MIKQKVYLSLIFTIILTTVFAQKSVNKFDKDGKRDGLWAKNYHKTDQKRYEGVFQHGKEIDSFKYYTLSKGKSVLSAVKVFNEKDSLADVSFFASNKKVISEGRMNGKRYIGQWIYYHKNSSAKMIIENFNEQGLLEGERKILYKNGLIAEIANYEDGKLIGEANWYSENKTLIKSSNYQNGELHGKTTNYDAKGIVMSEGTYVKDQKKEIWNYYKDGQLIKKIDHTSRKVIYKKAID
ncbi:toxin-antitoxin system YwqK family antitoxin [Winogradskyella sp. UBA3174]|uniref:toxin-antitoxin system YwqK family antitoxin n=1 Tax=Winogradskyella sp. UBA3174 TaxID=1947785 RepID=UPI0025EDFB0E|nr:toxin-antitoxin system YwqK family antitoxin [Winogradskyella sp. UBA3174]|tara:strand:+ start:14851 stop:15567 length:717 start_codon:yes stop_codon:yes gene_type:complete